jgi:GT2 family glycosyltransferase
LTEHDFVAARLEHRKLNADWLHPPYGDGYQSAGIRRLEGYPYLLSASACGCGFRRSLYEKVGPLSTTFPIAHDMEYAMRLQLAGYTLHFEPKALVNYRERSEMKARYRQGHNWGLDSTRVTEHYGTPRARFALPRHLVAMGRSLPQGLWGALLFALRRPEGQALLGEWIWNFGWSTGTLLALLQRPPVPAHPGRARAAADHKVSAGS